MAEAAVYGLVAMAAVMDAMNGCMRPANAAAKSSTAGFVRIRIFLLSVFVALLSNVGLINFCLIGLDVDIVRLRGKVMMG